MARSLPGTGLILLAAAAGGLGAAPPQAPPPRSIPVDEWVRQLGSADFQERETATRRLSGLTLDPPPAALVAAARSGDPEVRERAARALSAIRSATAESRLARGRRFAEQGRVDLLVAATATWDLKEDDRRLWEPWVDLGRALIERAEMKKDRKPLGCPCSYPDFDAYVKRYDPRFIRTASAYVKPDPEKAIPALRDFCLAVQAPGVAAPAGLNDSIVVSRGGVEVGPAIRTSVVFANGDVTVRTGTFESVIVCDGDVTITRSMLNRAVVVARGNITVKGTATTTFLAAGGKVALGENYKSPDPFAFSFNVIKENQTTPLGLRFFELSELGIELKPVDAVVRVTAIAPGKPCAAAGVKSGDVIAAVNGKKPESAESLRRLLRDALAVGDATVTLKRGDDTLTANVGLPD